MAVEDTYNAELAHHVASSQPLTAETHALVTRRLAEICLRQAQQIDRLERRLGRVQAMQLGLEALDRRVDVLEEAGE